MTAQIRSLALPALFHIEYVEVDGIRLRVGTRPGHGAAPLVLFNGIGANLELVEPFVAALQGPEVIIFDIPGIGGSENTKLPKRLPSLAKLTAHLLDRLGYREVDVAGVSWGGALAQVFARRYPDRCRRLILAATSAGSVMVPGKPSVLWKMATPNRYLSPRHMRRVAPHIYGGRIRERPRLIHRHAGRIEPPSVRGYIYQLLAGLGWTSIHWLHRLDIPTLILAGDDDPIVPLVNAKLMALCMPRAHLCIVHGGGHLFLLTQAQELAPLIEEFLSVKDPHGILMQAEDAHYEWMPTTA